MGCLLALRSLCGYSRPAMTSDPRQECLLDCVRAGGRILLEHFGKIRCGRPKECQSSIVTDADLAAEAWIVNHLRRRFPGDAIIAEESGFQPGSSDVTWVIDPLDGTSNFVAGLPWFGCQIGVLDGPDPVRAAMYLPIGDHLYSAERGGGVHVGGRRLGLTAETDLRQVLCAFGFDAAASEEATRRSAALLARVARGCRNVRATNSLVDFCLTLEGNLGACVNLNPKIWDILPACVMFPEAGGCLTDLSGRPLRFDPGPRTLLEAFPVAGASLALHPQLIALTRGWESGNLETPAN